MKNSDQGTRLNKILFVLSLICCIGVVILAFIQFLGVWDKAIYIFEPLIGVILLIQTIQNWKLKKSTAIISLITAICIFVLDIVMMVF